MNTNNSISFRELPEYCQKEAERLEDCRDYKGAVEMYTLLIAAAPESYRHYYNRGVMYGYLHRIDEAIADYSRALKLNPAHMNSRMNRGVAYRDKGEIEKAIADTEKCIEVDPNSVARVNLRGMYSDRESAKRRLEKLERSPLTWLLKKLR